MKSKNRKKFILLFSAGILVAVLAISPRIVQETSTPDFCVSCHVMEDQYESWFLTGLHRGISCVDCHLPHDNIFNHLMWKAIDGGKDVILFFGRLYTDSIAISLHGKKTVLKNCIRCHNEMVSRITAEDRICWDCHRQVKHKFPSAGLVSK